MVATETSAEAAAQSRVRCGTAAGPGGPQQPRGDGCGRSRVYVFICCFNQVPFYGLCNQFITKETFALCNDAFPVE